MKGALRRNCDAGDHGCWARRSQQAMQTSVISLKLRCFSHKQFLGRNTLSQVFLT